MFSQIPTGECVMKPCMYFVNFFALYGIYNIHYKGV